MASFIVDLDTLVETESPSRDELVTPVQVEDDFIFELKQTFGNRLESEEDLSPEFALENICREAWGENGDPESIQTHIITLADGLHALQKSNKGLLFHNTNSEILVAHYHENEGWVNDSGALVSGDRVDTDSVISMFALESTGEDLDNPIIDTDYYTESTTIMRLFGVLSDDILQEIPDQDVYLNGDPVYDERYLVKYSLDRGNCVEMLDDGSLSLDPESEEFQIEKHRDSEPRQFEYSFEGGRFGLSRSDDLSRFEREYIQYKHGWLTARRVYRHLVSEEGPYEEFRERVDIADSIVRKFEERTDRGHVVFSKHDDKGVVDPDFADTIVRAIAGRENYRLYFASHQDVPEHKALQFNSGNHELVFSNIDASSIEEKSTELQAMYNQATDDDLPRPRRYMTAAGLLAGINDVSGSTAAKSLNKIIDQSQYNGLRGYVKQRLAAAESPEDFRISLGSFFDTIGTETQTAALVEGGFERDSFIRLVGMIDNAGQSLELSAGDFSTLGEEGYRSVVTAAVDQRIDGSLVREAETGRGPSDIRLQNGDSETIYIGECKYWNENNPGAEANIKKPLEQLDTYDQHQLFNTIVVFFNSDDFSRLDSSTVWDRAEDKLQQYDENCEVEDEMPDTPRSRLYRYNPRVGEGERFLSLHVFDVGVEQQHETDTNEEEATA